MKGSIRFFVGLLITAGAVGHIDANPDADLLTQVIVASAGLAIMAWGVRDIKNAVRT